MKNVHRIEKCEKCSLNLPMEKGIIFNGKLYHESCFTCEACRCILQSTYNQKNGKPYCERDYLIISEAEKRKNCFGCLRIEHSSQPAPVQIANYNIQPAPILSISEALTSNETIHVYLVEGTCETALNGGFQAGEVRVLRAGQTSVTFAGLKLSKMGPIKSELNFANSRVLHSEFFLKFMMGNAVLQSTPFRLVSSCSQMPQELRENVRPPKKPCLKRGLVDSDDLRAKLSRTDSFLENIKNLNTSILNNTASLSNVKIAKEDITEDKEKTERQIELMNEEKKVRVEFETAVRERKLVVAATLAQDLAKIQRISKR